MNMHSMTDAQRYTLRSQFSALAMASNRASRDSGWWTNPATGEPKVRNKAEMMALMVTELVEMHRGVRDGGNDEHLKSRMNAVVEAADFIIRVGDYVHGFGGDLGVLALPWMEAEFKETGILGAICAVADAVESDRKGRSEEAMSHLARGAVIILRFSRVFLGATGADEGLFTVAYEKIAYNRQRADHKLENRALDGGKAY